MKRRDFVIGTGVVAGSAWLVSELPLPDLDATAETDVQGSPPMSNNIAAGRIDIHQQVIPDFYAQALQQQGLHRFAGLPLAHWSAEGALALLDTQQIQTALLALPAPGVFGGDSRAAALGRRCNEYVAELGQRYPRRFGNLAAVPLPATDLACAEAIYALDSLKADGIMLLASNDGVFLGDAHFDELLAELNTRQAVVLVQPNLHVSSTQLALQTHGFVLEFACDITRAAVNLILSGSMERYPHIRWILANAGGFLPYAAWRVSLANAMSEFQERAPLGVMNYLQRFYFDTSLAAGAPSMAVLKELVEPAHILYGSGYPSVPEALVKTERQALATALPSGQQLNDVLRGNALRLFPRYAEAGERVHAAPVYEPESTMQWLGRSARKPINVLAERFKD